MMMVEEKEKLEVKENMQFKELVDRAVEIEDGSFDLYEKPCEMEFSLSNYFNPRLNVGNKLFSISKHALSQLCGNIGLSRAFMAETMTKHQKHYKNTNDFGILMQDAVNSYMEVNNTDLLVRLYGEKVRGVLTTRYAQYDTPSLLDSIGDNIDMKNYRIVGSLLNEERFHVRAVNPIPFPTHNNLYHGFAVDSSDVGRSSVKVSFFIFDKICSNGMVIIAGEDFIFKKKHIGVFDDEGFGDTIRRLPEIAAEVDKKIVESFETRVSFQDREEIEKNIKEVATMLRVSRETSKEIVEKFDGTNQTKWDFISSITEVAQKFTFEERLRLERVAGELLMNEAA